MPSVECPVCGTAAECFSREVGNGYHETFTLVCSNKECGFVSEKTVKGPVRCNPKPHSYPAKCPFCEKKSFVHKSTPREYRS